MTRPWYVERPAAADLRGPLACAWRAEVGGTRTLVPDGCFDLLWVDDGSMWLCGPETAAWSFTLPPGTEAVGVRFRPGVAPAVLGLDAAELRDDRIRLAQLTGDAGTRRLAGRIGDQRGAAARVEVLEAEVRGRVGDAADRVDPVAGEVARCTAMPGAGHVHRLAAELGLSERQLRRRCTRAFGYGPAVLARILRLQRFLAHARASGTAGGLATLALTAGYADQPHLARDVRAIAGMTPTDLLDAERVRSVQDSRPPAAGDSTHE